MKILYDHQMFSMQKYGGITKYFSELFYNIEPPHVCKLSVLSSDNHYLNAKKDFFKIKNVLPDKNFKGKYSVKKIISNVNKMHSVSQIKKGDFDLMHPTFYDTYFLNYLKKPFVITVHDLTAFKFNDPFYERGPLKAQMKETITKADRLIAVSENTKRDTMEIFNIKPEKIDVVYHGFNMPEKIAQTNQYGDYILFVGNRDGYKNFMNFAKAASLLLKKEKGIKIICVGQPFTKQEINEFSALNILDRICAMSVTEDQLNNLYSGALAFVYPSLYEGFGMSILEAFANNCPVCLSEASCFPEIAKDGAVYFDPNSVESIHAAIEKIIYNKAFTEEKINAGAKRLTDFSWKEAAKQTILSYSKIV